MPASSSPPAARELGFDEPHRACSATRRHAPYQRPPLSKGLLTGKTSGRPAAPCAAPTSSPRTASSCMLGRRATALDLGARSACSSPTAAVSTTAGSRWPPAPAAGPSRCRAPTLDGVLELRTLDDALRVRRRRRAAAQRACVIGGGFIGLEVASALRARGAEVTVVEGPAAACSRAAFPPLMSAYVEDAHRRRGVAIADRPRRARAARRARATSVRVELDDGRRIDCDLVVLGVGVLPNVELARGRRHRLSTTASSSTCCGRTIAHRGAGRRRRRQHGAAARCPVAGAHAPRIHPGRQRRRARRGLGAGRPAAAAHRRALVLERPVRPQAPDGRPAAPRRRGRAARRHGRATASALFYLRDGALVAAHSVNKPAEHMQSRKLIAAARADPAPNSSPTPPSTSKPCSLIPLASPADRFPSEFPTMKMTKKRALPP